MLYHFVLPGNFYYGSEIRHGIFLGINFGPAIFWVLSFTPIRSSLSLEIRSTGEFMREKFMEHLRTFSDS